MHVLHWAMTSEILRLMFKDLPADKIAKAFIDLARRAKLMTLKFDLNWELSRLKPKIAGARKQAEKSAKLGHTIHARRFDNFANIQYYMDEPLADPSAIALYFVANIASQNVKVSLSGEGADEILPHHRL